MPNTPTGTIDGGITLGANGYSSPFTNGGSIFAGGTEGVGVFVGVFSTIAGAELINNGFIRTRGPLTFLQSGLYSVEFTNGGTVFNAGYVNAYDAAIHISGGAGYVSNTGTIFSNDSPDDDPQVINAIYLADGGQVINNGPTAYISGAVITSASGTVTNENGATIAGPGIDLTAGGTVINDAIIQSGGVRIHGAPGTVINDGTFKFSVLIGNGVFLYDGGTITNPLTSSLLRGDAEIEGGPGVILNAGTLKGYDGVFLKDGGTVSNIGSASYIFELQIGYFNGPVLGSLAGTVFNQGTITGDPGVELFQGGYVENAAGAQIQESGVIANAAATIVNAGYITGVDLTAGGTIVNTGTIGPVTLGGDGQNRLLLGAHATFIGSSNGLVTGSTSASNLIELQAGAGTLNGLGTKYVGFATIDLDAGAAWTIAGDAAGLNGETITNFAPGNTIDITDYTVLDDTFSAGIGLILQNGVSPETIALSGNFQGEYFTYSSNGAGGSLLYLTPNRPVYHHINYAPLSTITNFVTYGVTLGFGNYASQLTITDTGAISNTTGYAVLASTQATNGYLLNEGTISSVSINSAATVVNNGAIASNRRDDVNLDVTAGVGVFINAGTLTGLDGILGIGNVMITNTGLIRPGQRDNGVTLAGGAIGATLVNSGLINGYLYGVNATGNSTIINTGTIFGNFNAVELTAGSTLIDFGLVNSPNLDIADDGGDLVIEPGAAFGEGIVTGYDRQTYGITLAGTTAGSLDMAGVFEDVATITFAPGALWTLKNVKYGFGNSTNVPIAVPVITGFAGGDTLVLTNAAYTGGYVSTAGIVLTNASTSQLTLYLDGIVDSQEFTVSTNGTTTSIAGVFGPVVSGTATTPSGSFANAPTITSGGTEQIDSGATVVDPIIAGGALVINGGGSIDGDITFTGTGGSLVIDAGTGGTTTIPQNIITGFTAGDTIELAGIPFSGTGTFGAPNADSYTVATPGTLTIDADGTDYTLLIAGATVGQNNFVLSGDLGVTETPACFAAGTRLLTAAGNLVTVENLREGDELETLDGAAKITWIGYRHLALTSHPRPETVQPILIAAGALGQGLPWRDLVLSPDHALYLDGHLIPAKTLLNGFSIRQLRHEKITYYHIELPDHAILFAEGAAAESYLETGNRAAFENAGAALILHPDFAQTLRESKSCARFAESGAAVEAVRRRLLDFAQIETTTDPALRIRFQNGAAIIDSRSAIPGEITPDPRDRRRLGVKLAALDVAGQKIPLDHPALAEGWHAPEPEGRWTNGRAVIPRALLAGLGSIEISLAATMIYPLEGQNAPATSKERGTSSWRDVI